MVDLLNDAIKEAYEFAPQDITYWDTLEIDHQSFTEPIRVVRDYRKLTTLQGEFLPVMFDFSLPGTEYSVRGEMIVTLQNIPHEPRLKIREASTSRDKITVVYRQYIAENADPDVELPVALQVRSIKETVNGLEARTTFPDLVSARFPRRIMTVEELPGCRLWPVSASGGISSAIAGSGDGYVFGGYGSSTYYQDCDEFAPDVWTSKTDMPLPGRRHSSICTIDISGYIFGGDDGWSVQDCDKYTLDTWLPIANLLLPARNSAAASTISSKGYLYGGSSTQDLQLCDEYTPNVWASKTNMPAPARYGLAASTIGDKGYVYGGNNHIQDCDEYAPDAWASKTDIPLPGRYRLAASTINSKGYIYGGAGPGLLQDCDEYTPDTWVSRADMPLPARYNLAASTIGARGYIYGGYNIQDCDEYMPDTWASKSNVPAPIRVGMAASTI